MRTLPHRASGAAAAMFLLFAIALFGAMLLVPLYFQVVRGERPSTPAC